ncbi:MAG TPA: lasso peptide biosynthesis B2 protein [Balneolaceae bacterium]|nr:lasso peptide biosynthesis B2 protein [Balneolaceae bacterium]
MKSLPSFLLGGDTLPSPQIIRDNNLASYAYVTIPKDHQHKENFKPEYLRALNRHYAIKKDVREILEAWASRGIEAMLLKGFYLSEFIYPAPGMRFHRDVDVLIHPDDKQKAFEIARSQGWEIVKELNRNTELDYHEAFVIYNNNGGTYMEIHRHLFHSRNKYLPHRKQKKVSRKIWENARDHDWEGIKVKLPTPVDAALILALHRFWGDGFQIEPQDPIDLRFLIQKKNVTKEELIKRAASLHCKKTVKAFLERCNPWDNHLQLSNPTKQQLTKWSLQILPERGLVLYETKLLSLFRIPATLMDIIFVLPTVVWVRLMQRRSANIPKLVARLTPNETWHKQKTKKQYPERRLVRGVKWALRLLGLSSPGPCLLRSLALYRLLRKQEKPAKFVCGLRKVDGEVRGHAWVEIDDLVLPALKEPNNRSSFNISFQYPDTSLKK